MTKSLKTKIFTLADELKNHGQNPTNKLIREKLGKYSYSQISPILREWKELRLGYRKKDTPTEVEASIARMGNEIWNIALERSNRTFQNQYDILRLKNKEQEKEIIELTQQLQKTEHARLNQRILELETELETKDQQLELTLSLNDYDAVLPNLVPDMLNKHHIERHQFNDFLQEVTNVMEKDGGLTNVFSYQIKDDHKPAEIIQKAYFKTLEICGLLNYKNNTVTENSKLLVIRLVNERFEFYGGKIDKILDWFTNYDTYFNFYRNELLQTDKGIHQLSEKYKLAIRK